VRTIWVYEASDHLEPSRVVSSVAIRRSESDVLSPSESNRTRCAVVILSPSVRRISCTAEVLHQDYATSTFFR
jgi:hypothetical protein